MPAETRTQRLSRTTMNSLPNELIARIVKLSAPPPSWSRARKTHLRNCALVSRAFRNPAQEELFRHILLLAIPSSQLLVAVLKSAEGSRFAGLVRSLRVQPKKMPADRHVAGFNASPEQLGIPSFFELCSGLEELWLAQVGPAALESLAAGPALKSLYLSGCHIEPGTDTQTRDVPTLALRRLSVAHTEARGGLRPQAFPKLEALSIIRSYWEEFVAELAPQLRALHLAGDEADDLLDGASHFRELSIIDIDHDPDYSVTAEFLRRLPASQIHHLRVEPNPRTTAPATVLANFISDRLHPTSAQHLQSTNEMKHIRFPHYNQVDSLALTQAVALARPGQPVTVSFDPAPAELAEHCISGAEFLPKFWTFVDDVEREERQRARQG